jgi:hypothetical protein
VPVVQSESPNVNIIVSNKIKAALYYLSVGVIYIDVCSDLCPPCEVEP